MVQLALRLRVNTILSAGWVTPDRRETLGIGKVANAAAGYVGGRPLPPAIDHQIDVAMWVILRREHDGLIKGLKRKLFRNAHKSWFETLLTFFVALSCVSMYTQT